MKSVGAFILLAAAIQATKIERVKLTIKYDWRLIYEDNMGLWARNVSPRHERYFHQTANIEGCASTLVGPVTGTKYCVLCLRKNRGCVLKVESGKEKGKYVVIPPAMEDEAVVAAHTDDVWLATYIQRTWVHPLTLTHS